MDEEINQSCEGCWIHEEGVTKRNEAEAKGVIERCATRKLRRLLYDEGCPAACMQVKGHG